MFGLQNIYLFPSVLGFTYDLRITLVDITQPIYRRFLAVVASEIYDMTRTLDLDVKWWFRESERGD